MKALATIIFAISYTAGLILLKASLLHSIFLWYLEKSLDITTPSLSFFIGLVLLQVFLTYKGYSEGEQQSHESLEDSLKAFIIKALHNTEFYTYLYILSYLIKEILQCL